MKRIQVYTFLMVVFSLVSVKASQEIEFLRIPNGGIQPHAVVDRQGTLHLIYFKGNEETGNLFYVTRKPGELEWSMPIQVNSQEGSDRRNGAIGYARMAIWKKGGVHVVWFNMQSAKYWYTRKENNKGYFEKQKNLVTKYNKGVEAGASIAVDWKGRVFVVWHAGDLAHEDRRAVYITVSRDRGQTFTPERRAIPDQTGVCACCGLDSLVADQGLLYISYRSAKEKTHRDMVLLKSTDGAQNFSSQTMHEWELNGCPVSTTTIAGGTRGPIVAWETKGQVFFAHVKNLADVESAPGDSIGRRKNPAVAINNDGKILLAWAEGNDWQSGGQLHWQIFDAQGKVTRESGWLEENVPDFSITEVVAMKDGSFVVIY